MESKTKNVEDCIYGSVFLPHNRQVKTEREILYCKKGVNVKKLLIVVTVVMVALAVLGSKAFAQERAQRLYGYVTYEGGSYVGSGKPVEIWEEESPPARPPITYTDENSMYVWRFYPPYYVYKVRCLFHEGAIRYSGETIIDDTLYTDTRVDIVVTPE